MFATGLMITKCPIIVVVLALTLGGCGEQKPTAAGPQPEAAANAQAAGARKEMDTLPKAYQPRYNKRLEPQPTTPAPQTKPEEKKP